MKLALIIFITLAMALLGACTTQAPTNNETVTTEAIEVTTEIITTAETTTMPAPPINWREQAEEVFIQHVEEFEIKGWVNVETVEFSEEKLHTWFNLGLEPFLTEGESIYIVTATTQDGLGLVVTFLIFSENEPEGRTFDTVYVVSHDGRQMTLESAGWGVRTHASDFSFDEILSADDERLRW